MDVVIPYINSSSNGVELRYSLRSIELFFPELENIFIIGDCPGFLQNVIHIPATDAPETHSKARNIMRKLLIACHDKRVSEEFAMFNDDHFLLKEWSPTYHYSGTLEQSIAKFTIYQNYRQTLINTMAFLNGGKDFDTHSPIVYRKEVFIRTMEMVDWSRHCGYAIKSLYCNLSGIEGEQRHDLKIRHPLKSESLLKIMVEGNPYFSISDYAINDSMTNFLQELFPQKSIYESD